MKIKSITAVTVIMTKMIIQPMLVIRIRIILTAAMPLTESEVVMIIISANMPTA